jgi:hypothetical protein
MFFVVLLLMATIVFLFGNVKFNPSNKTKSYGIPQTNQLRAYLFCFLYVANSGRVHYERRKRPDIGPDYSQTAFGNRDWACI